MAVYRLDFGGPLYADIWTCRIHLNGEIDQDLQLLSPVDLQTVLDDIESDLKTWWTTSDFIGPAKLSWLKLNEINPDTGKYISQSTTIGKEWTPVAGTATMEAPQLSLAVSWHTANRRGRAAKGRIYPPPSEVSFDNITGQVHITYRQEAATRGATLINNLNNWPGIDSPFDLNCIVLGMASEKRAQETGDDAYLTHRKNNITAVAVGSVLDTQRRRRSALKETYEVVAVA